MTIGCPKLAKPVAQPTTLPTWEKIFDIAKKSTNDHVIKFIYTAFEEFNFYQIELYHLAAAKKSGLLKM